MNTIQPKTFILEKEDLEKLGIKGRITSAVAANPENPKAYAQGVRCAYIEVRITANIEESPLFFSN